MRTRLDEIVDEELGAKLRPSSNTDSYWLTRGEWLSFSKRIAERAYRAGREDQEKVCLLAHATAAKMQAAPAEEQAYVINWQHPKLDRRKGQRRKMAPIKDLLETGEALGGPIFRVPFLTSLRWRYDRRSGSDRRKQ